MGRYILDGRRPVPCPDLATWVRWFKRTDRHVAWSIRGGVDVSTFFLGLDHNPEPVGPPLLFATTVFGGPLDGEIVLYVT